MSVCLLYCPETLCQRPSSLYSRDVVATESARCCVACFNCVCEKKFFAVSGALAFLVVMMVPYCFGLNRLMGQLIEIDLHIIRPSRCTSSQAFLKCWRKVLSEPHCSMLHPLMTQLLINRTNIVAKSGYPLSWQSSAISAGTNPRHIVQQSRVTHQPLHHILICLGGHSPGA